MNMPLHTQMHCNREIEEEDARLNVDLPAVCPLSTQRLPKPESAKTCLRIPDLLDPILLNLLVTAWCNLSVNIRFAWEAQGYSQNNGAIASHPPD